MEKALFYKTMRNASLVSYAVAIFAICSSIAQSIISYSALGPIEEAIAEGVYDPATIAAISNMLISILPGTLIILGITILLTIFFAYYTFKVGQIYEMGTIKISGTAYVIMQVAVIPVIFAAYALLPLLPALISDPSSVMSQLLGILILILVGGLMAFVFLLVFIIAFVIGLHRMRIETGITLFDAAMWLAIIGIILSFLNSIFTAIGLPISIGGLLMQVSIIVFGVALGKAGKEERVPTRLKERLAPGET